MRLEQANATALDNFGSRFEDLTDEENIRKCLPWDEDPRIWQAYRVLFVRRMELADAAKQMNAAAKKERQAVRRLNDSGVTEQVFQDEAKDQLILMPRLDDANGPTLTQQSDVWMRSQSQQDRPENMMTEPPLSQGKPGFLKNMQLVDQF